ncbi:hypothetical protein AB0J40_29685 [Amycolatopsis sp. NPDC049691]|uniref:hypothetical protein n=1 Tax=Amycolatopsis sp. NPDC049691 TaxID=3155155 RepID=UPI003441EFC8
MAPARSPLSKTDPLLRPGFVPEEFQFGARSQIFYKAPYPAEGPVEAKDASGRRMWMYMYAHFVFQWSEGASSVHIGHGTLAGSKMSLWTDVRIAGSWSGAVLADFGRDWVSKHLAKFAK